MNKFYIFIYLIFFLFLNISCAFSQNQKDQKINELLKHMGTSVEQVLGSDTIDNIKNYTIPENIQKKADKDFKSENKKLQERVDFYKTEITKKNLKNFIPQEQEPDKNNLNILHENEYIFVCISSSIPKTTLTNYIASIEKLNNNNIKIILRGFINGMKKIKPTQDFITDIVLKNPSCKNDTGGLTKECEAYRSNITIDPLIFRKFNIQTVPAIIYAKNLNLNDPDRSIGYPGNIKEGAEDYILFGDISLDYALSRFYDATKNKKFLNLQKKLRKGFY